MSWEKSFLKCGDGILSILEAWEIFLAEHHHFNKNDNFICVLLKGHETKLDEVSKKFIVLTSESSKHLDTLGCKFERGLLELETLSWGI